MDEFLGVLVDNGDLSLSADGTMTVYPPRTQRALERYCDPLPSELSVSAVSSRMLVLEIGRVLSASIQTEVRDPLQEQLDDFLLDLRKVVDKLDLQSASVEDIRGMLEDLWTDEQKAKFSVLGGEVSRNKAVAGLVGNVIGKVLGV